MKRRKMFRNKSIKNIAFIYVIRSQAVATCLLLIIHEIPQIACPLNWFNIPITIWSLYKFMKKSSSWEQIAPLRKLQCIISQNIYHVHITSSICPSTPITLTI